MTRLLLERSADPNDGGVAYHTPETLDNRAMKVLVESGKLTPLSMMWLLCRKFNWHDDDTVAWRLEHGSDRTFAASWGNRPLHQALQDSTPISYFELLLDRGAGPTLPGKGGVSSFALAARLARADVLDLFERAALPQHCAATTRSWPPARGPMKRQRAASSPTTPISFTACNFKTALLSSTSRAPAIRQPGV
jgi:hypothetical protein